MKIFKTLTLIATLSAAFGAHAATTDTVQAPTGFFVSSDAAKYNSPYYRWAADDWEWQHNAIGGSISSATLNISAFDVDAAYGEVDNIYAWDSGSWTLLGSLAGADDSWAFSTFTLGANFYDDIANGLKVRIDIDSTNDGWAVTLAKSSLAIDGGALPPPPPVPEPETYAMLLAGLGLTRLMTRRRKV